MKNITHNCVLILLLNVLQFRGGVSPPPNKTYPKLPPPEALDFMKKFGYLAGGDDGTEALYTDDGLSDAVKLVQKFGAIAQTGILDNATLTLMKSKRCGVADVYSGNKRRKRYVLGPDGWNKRHLTYFLANWSARLGENSVMKNIQLALDTWGKYGRLTFRRVFTPDADIIVAFGRGYHGDRYAFDGPGYVLAHAFYPYEQDNMGGDIHFDDDENWTDRHQPGADKNGVDFFTVALHELGHSLGLAHSPVPSSIMFPYYQGFEENSDFQLGYDDILGMYELYIRRNLDGDNKEGFSPEDPELEEPNTSSTTEYYYYTPPTTPYEPTTTETKTYYDNSTVMYEGDTETVDEHKNHDDKHGIPPTNSPTLPDICKGSFDAVATLRNELFIFKDQYVWRLKEKGRIEPGYPSTIYQMFPQLPENVKKIDAAYERPDGMIVLFTGNKFWVYDGRTFIEGSPLPLNYYGLPSGLDNIDAVQIWGRNRKTYFYKNERFWRYNETSKQMDPGYPKHMEKWRKIPENLDAATTWKDGYTYFFKGELYWKFDNDWVVATEQSPMPAPQVWLGCEEDEKTMRKYFS